MIDRFSLPTKSNTHYLLPIIPLFDFTEKVEREVNARRLANPGPVDIRNVNFEEANLTWKAPFPQIDAKDVLDLEAPIHNRLKAIVNCISERAETPVKTEPSEEEQRIQKYLEKEFRRGWWAQTSTFLFGGIVAWMAKKQIVSLATDFSLKSILKGLNESKLLRF